MPQIEPEPEAASTVFGAGIERARQYTADLARRGEELGLIGPLELPRLWSRHVINSGLVAEVVKPGNVADVGSGAGLPGIPLAIICKDSHFVLIEPMERRVEWLRHEVAELGLDNVEVLRGRSEDVHIDEPMDQVTARAVSSLSKLIPITVGLLRRGGELIFMKGERVQEEIEAAQKVIRRENVSNAEVLVLGQGITPEVTRVFRATVD
ncbi:MAG: 16S rRNA (guanine(527)-N(7))-methyltransferase RsmG [Actinomycetota bacterium]|nr:16S rRNA (guanine(527)-N(7))-methyltransferase RsmG [Actinomycetota bacterium]